MAGEAQLRSDADWKIIQENIFTRWCNEHLKSVNQIVTVLDSDLSDGLKLIALLQVLSHKRLPRYNRRPRMRAQKMENVELALQFICQDQNIWVTNIVAADILDGNLKIILALIWTLILHYSIRMPMGEDEDLSKAGTAGVQNELLSWIQNKIPELAIKNFTTDWNDGRSISALVNACAPGLYPDWKDLDENEALKNANQAIKLAHDWLDVPQLLMPEEMCNPKVDELSIKTYLAGFLKSKLKEGAPLRPR